MPQYKVESDRLEGFAVGAVIADSDLPEGTNVDALIAGGFISPAVKRTTEKTTGVEEKNNG